MPIMDTTEKRFELDIKVCPNIFSVYLHERRNENVRNTCQLTFRIR